jgi:hypothetical protein
MILPGLGMILPGLGMILPGLGMILPGLGMILSGLGMILSGLPTVPPRLVPRLKSAREVGDHGTVDPKIDCRIAGDTRNGNLFPFPNPIDASF